MANRVLLGNRTTGGYGLYVSRLTSNVLDCANDKLMFNTNSGQTGSNFVSAGHFQVVPVSGGTGSSAPVASSTTTVSANSTATASYQNFASTTVMLTGLGAAHTAGDNTSTSYAYSSIGSTSATLTNTNPSSRAITSVAFNLLNGAALF